MSTTEETLKLIRIAHAVSEVIRDLGEVPEGVIYTQLMEIMNLHQFEQVIDLLVDARLVERDRSHLLRWIGPAANPKPTKQ